MFKRIFKFFKEKTKPQYGTWHLRATCKKCKFSFKIQSYDFSSVLKLAGFMRDGDDWWFSYDGNKNICPGCGNIIITNLKQDISETCFTSLYEIVVGRLTPENKVEFTPNDESKTS